MFYAQFTAYSLRFNLSNHSLKTKKQRRLKTNQNRFPYAILTTCFMFVYIGFN